MNPEQEQLVSQQLSWPGAFAIAFVVAAVLIFFFALAWLFVREGYGVRVKFKDNPTTYQFPADPERTSAAERDRSKVAES